MAAGAIYGSETSLQPVAERHEFIDLRDDTVLLGERRKGEWHCNDLDFRDVGLRSTFA